MPPRKSEAGASLPGGSQQGRGEAECSEAGGRRGSSSLPAPGRPTRRDPCLPPHAVNPSPRSRPLPGPQERRPHFPPRRLPAAPLNQNPVLPPELPLLGPLLQEALRAVTTPHCPLTPRVHSAAAQPAYPWLEGRRDAPPRLSPRAQPVLIPPARRHLLRPSENGQFRQTPSLPAQRAAEAGRAGVWGLRKGDKSRSTPALWLAHLAGRRAGPWRAEMRVPGAPGGRTGPGEDSGAGGREGREPGPRILSVLASEAKPARAKHSLSEPRPSVPLCYPFNNKKTKNQPSRKFSRI